MKSHTIGVLLFGLATAASLTLLYGVDLSRSWIEVSGSVAKEYQVPIRRVQRTEKLAALTFDTCRDSENLREILDILEKRQVKTTFFISGDWAGAHPEDVREIAEAGQELGVCGREYRDMRGLSGDEAREELAEVKEQVQELGGQPVTLFRPPGGDAGGRLVRSAEDCGTGDGELGRGQSGLERLRSGRYHREGCRPGGDSGGEYRSLPDREQIYGGGSGGDACGHRRAGL